MDDSPAKLMLEEFKQLIELYRLQARLLRVDERQAHEPKPGERILRLREVVRQCGISKKTVYRLEAAGRFPARRQLGPRAVGWSEVEVGVWIKNPAAWGNAAQDPNRRGG